MDNLDLLDFFILVILYLSVFSALGMTSIS